MVDGENQRKSSGVGSNTDDEYMLTCIIDTQPYTSQDNDLDELIVNWIRPGPGCMVDNHFTVPAVRTDVLKSPKSFSLPMLRYMLCEMSVTWNMFGGMDFKQAMERTADNKRVTIEGDRKQGSPVAPK